MDPALPGAAAADHAGGAGGCVVSAGFRSTALRLVFPRQCTQSAEHGAIHHESTRSRTCWRFRADPSSQQAEPSQPNKLSPTCSLTAAEELIYGLDNMSTMHQMRITDARRIVQARPVSASARVDGCGEVAVQPSVSDGCHEAEPCNREVALRGNAQAELLMGPGVFLPAGLHGCAGQTSPGVLGKPQLTRPRPMFVPNRRSWWSALP